MVKVSTLHHRVDGFNGIQNDEPARGLPEQQDIEAQFLNQLLEPLLFDPGDEIVQRILSTW